MPGLANFGNSKQFAFKYTFDMQTNQPKPHWAQFSLSGVHTLGQYPPALITPGPGRYQTTKGSHYTSRANWNYSILSLLILFCLFLPKKTTVKTLAHQFPPLSLVTHFILVLPQETLYRMIRLLLPGVNETFFMTFISMSMWLNIFD